MHIHRARSTRILLAASLAAAVAGCWDHRSPLSPEQAPALDIDHHHAPGDGTHLRGGNMTWRAVGTNLAEITYTITFRTSFFYSTPPAVGTRAGFATVVLGDGWQINPWFTITFVDVAEDWFEARAVFQRQYAGPGPYTLSNEICCRLSPAPWNQSTSSGAYPWDLRNNADQVYRVRAVVNFASGGAPTTGLPPVITCPKSGDCQFNVPAAASAGQTVRWRMATTSEMNGSNPPGASINPTTGLYTWDTRGVSTPTYTQPGWKTVYSTQVALESLDGSGSMVGKSVVDFLIHLVDVEVNAPPMFIAPSPADGSSLTVTTGQTLNFVIRASDPNTADLVSLSALGLPPGATFVTPTAANPVSSNFSWTPQPDDVGSYVINFRAVDSRGLNSAPLSISITVEEQTNQAPVARPGGPYTGSEGFAVSLTGTGSSDPDGDALTYAWDFGDGNTGTGATPSHTYQDNGVYTVQLTVNDGLVSNTATTTATIANMAPVVDAITGLPADPITPGVAVSLRAGFTDAGVLDAHAAQIDWGDGTIGAGTVAQGAGSGAVTGSHAYSAAGVYTVTVMLTDSDGDSGQSSYSYVVVYDPAGGFVTGGGWIDVPAGSYSARPSAAGPARFGFVSKYLPGRNAPDGSTQFQFQAAGMNLHSTSYEWLVVAGARAQFKGTATINRNGGYCFLLTAIDGRVNGGGGTDRLRLKVWDCATEAIVFDNQIAASDDVVPTAITQGRIVIHR
jgi:PKD repeat protein